MFTDVLVSGNIFPDVSNILPSHHIGFLALHFVHAGRLCELDVKHPAQVQLSALAAENMISGYPFVFGCVDSNMVKVTMITKISCIPSRFLANFL